MSEVQRFWSHELSTSSRCVFESDFDRVTAERDAALGREAVLREELAKAKKGNIYKHAALVSKAKALNAADERVGVMDRVEARYRWLQKATPYRFKKIQDASVTDGGDVLYFHADRFDAAVDDALKPAEGGGDD